MITLISDSDLNIGYVQGAHFQELYVDTDVFYKMFYIFNQMGLSDYFTFEVDKNGKGVYVRIVTKEVNRNEIC